MQLLCPIFILKFEQEKKSLCKSFSKSIYVDIGGIASVNYLKVKKDVTYWKTIIPDRNQIHAAPSFLLLSS